MKDKSIKLTLFFVLLLFVIGGVLIYFGTSSSPKEKPSSNVVEENNKENENINESDDEKPPKEDNEGQNTVEEVTFDSQKEKERLNEKVIYLNAEIAQELIIKDNKAVISLHNGSKQGVNMKAIIYPYNPETQVIDINKELYISPLLTPNQTIEEIEFKEPMKEGETDAVAILYCYSETGEQLGNTTVQLTIKK